MGVDAIKPPTALTRRFVRSVLGFSVGVAIGLAPFLGEVNLPGFRALLNLLPLQLRDGLISLSAFLMGLVAVSLQFYSTEKVSLAKIRKLFRWAIGIIIVGFLLLVALYNEFIVRVPRGRENVSVMISSSRTQECSCGQASDTLCIQELSLNPAAIEHCWGSRPLRRIGLMLTVSYLVLTGGFGALVGLLLLQEGIRRRESRQRTRKPVRTRKPEPSPPPDEQTQEDPGDRNS